MAITDSSPRAFAAISIGDPQMLEFLFRSFSLPDAVTFRRGVLAHPRV
jgi:hypothetical protein